MVRCERDARRMRSKVKEAFVSEGPSYDRLRKVSASAGLRVQKLQKAPSRSRGWAYDQMQEDVSSRLVRPCLRSTHIPHLYHNLPSFLDIHPSIFLSSIPLISFDLTN